MTGRAKFVADHATLAALLEAARSAGQRIVLTNGAFDLLHVGHVRSLLAARAEGDCLVVALNTDAAVRRAKGPGRPVVPESERAELVAALECVDFVTLFDEPTAEGILRRLRPAVYAKGTDYDPERLPEAAAARAIGARLAFTGDEKSHGTTDLIQRIRAAAPPHHGG